VSLFDEYIEKKIHIGKNLRILGLDLDPDPHIMNADPKHYLQLNKHLATMDNYLIHECSLILSSNN
jgi:hypothetical protein